MRISPNRRLDRVFDLLLKPGSIERAVFDLPDDLRADYDRWRARSMAVAARYADRPGALYEVLLDGDGPMPPMPPHLRARLETPVPRITVEMSAADAAEAYRTFLEGA